MAQPRPRKSQPPASGRPAPKTRLVIGKVAVTVTESHLRLAFGRQQHADLKRIRDLRIERQRLHDIDLSDRELRAANRRSAELERAIDQMQFRLGWVKEERPRRRQTGQHERSTRITRDRPLPSYPRDIIDKAGRHGIFVQITTARNNDRRYPLGNVRSHWEYIWDENAVEQLADGTRSRHSNMGLDDDEIGAAMDLQEEVARASRANATLCVRIIVRLPDDVSPEARFLIMHMISEEVFGQHGLPFAFAVHEPGTGGNKRNPHGHLQGSWRPMERVGDHEWAVGSELRSDLSGPEGLRLIRRIAASAMTDVSQAVGVEKTYTALSHRERGLPFLPLKKIGQQATAAWRRGEDVAVVEENAKRIHKNMAAYEKLTTQWEGERSSTPRAEPSPIAAEARMPIPSTPVARPPSMPVSLPSSISVSAGIEPAWTTRSNRQMPVPTPTFPAASSAPRVTTVPAISMPRQANQMRVPVPQVGGSEAFIPSKVPVPELVRSGHPTGLVPVPAPPQSSIPNALPPRVPGVAETGLGVRTAPKKQIVSVPVPALATPLPPADSASRAALDALIFFGIEKRRKEDHKEGERRVKRLREELIFLRVPANVAAPDYVRFYQQAAANPTWLRWSLGPNGPQGLAASRDADPGFAYALELYRTHPQVQKDLAPIVERTTPAGLPPHIRAGLRPHLAHDPRTGTKYEPLRAPQPNDPAFEQAIRAVVERGPQLHRQDGLIGLHAPAVEAIAGRHILGFFHPAVQSRLAAQMYLQKAERNACVAAIESGSLHIERMAGKTFEDAGRVVLTTGRSAAGWVIVSMARWAEDPLFVIACADARRRADRFDRRTAQDDPAHDAWRRASVEKEGAEVLALLAEEALRRSQVGGTPYDPATRSAMARDAAAARSNALSLSRGHAFLRHRPGKKLGRQIEGKEKT